jgi:predicted kinase
MRPRMFGACLTTIDATPNDVVLDKNFWTRADRNSARSAVASLGATCKLYDLTCSPSDAWRRIDARNNNLDGSLLITRNTFDVLKAKYEPLGDDEERITMQS